MQASQFTPDHIAHALQHVSQAIATLINNPLLHAFQSGVAIMLGMRCMWDIQLSYMWCGRLGPRSKKRAMPQPLSAQYHSTHHLSPVNEGQEQPVHEPAAHDSLPAGFAAQQDSSSSESDREDSAGPSSGLAAVADAARPGHPELIVPAAVPLQAARSSHKRPPCSTLPTSSSAAMQHAGRAGRPSATTTAALSLAIAASMSPVQAAAFHAIQTDQALSEAFFAGRLAAHQPEAVAPAPDRCRGITAAPVALHQDPAWKLATPHGTASLPETEGRCLIPALDDQCGAGKQTGVLAGLMAGYESDDSGAESAPAAAPAPAPAPAPAASQPASQSCTAACASKVAVQMQHDLIDDAAGWPAQPSMLTVPVCPSS